MVDLDRGYGPTVEEMERFTNKTVTSVSEFERQRTRAQELFDAMTSTWPKFHQPIDRQVSITSSTATTFVATELDSDKDDFYNNMRMTIKEGTAAGFEGFVSNYDSSTMTLTVSGAFSSNPDSTSVAFVEQIATFPRFGDRTPDNRPKIPEEMPRIIAYIIEYQHNIDNQRGFNSSSLEGSAGGIKREKIGEWETEYATDDDDSEIKALIGVKAYIVAKKSGFFRRNAKLVKHGFFINDFIQVGILGRFP